MATKTYLDKRSLWVAIVTAILILIIVTVGVAARLLLDEYTSRLVIITLIILLCIIGLSSLSYLEVRKRTIRKENENLTVKNGNLYQKVYQPSAPNDPNWEYTNRVTYPAK